MRPREPEQYQTGTQLPRVERTTVLIRNPGNPWKTNHLDPWTFLFWATVVIAVGSRPRLDINLDLLVAKIS